MGGEVGDGWSNQRATFFCKIGKNPDCLEREPIRIHSFFNCYITLCLRSKTSFRIMSFVVYYEFSPTAYNMFLTGIVGGNGRLYWLQKDAEALFCETIQKNTLCALNVIEKYDIFPIASDNFLKEQIITHEELFELFEKTKIFSVRKFGKILKDRQSLMKCIKEEDCIQFMKPTLIRILDRKMRPVEQCQVKAFLMDFNSPITFFVWLSCFKVRVQQELYNLKPVLKDEKFIFPKRLALMHDNQIVYYYRKDR